jgi:hypothetical protein
MMAWSALLRTRAEGWTILVRLMVGLIVFLPEGIQKLAFPGILGAGRFADIGIPYPEMLGPFVGTVEIVCGVLIILGLLARFAAVPLIVIMVVAIVRPSCRFGRVTISGSFTCRSWPVTASGAWPMRRATIFWDRSTCLSRAPGHGPWTQCSPRERNRLQRRGS